MKKKDISEINETAWSMDAPKDDYPALSESFETDVCIIGGGLAGMLSAYLLHRAGLRIAVAEKNTIGGGATGFTTAFLTASLDTSFADLIRSFGPEGARMIIDSHSKAIDLIEEIAKCESIECEFKRCPNYIYATSEKDFSILDEEADAALELGLDAILDEDGSKLAFKNFGCIEIRNQAKFHPLKFLYGLTRVLSGEGVKIFEHTEAQDILDRDFGHSVRALEHSIQAKWVISTTYEPYDEPLRLYFKKGMYKTYVIEARTEWKLPEGTYEDTDNPYHYLRVDDLGTTHRVIAGGIDHREDVPLSEKRNFKALETYLESIIPKESLFIEKKWTGPILEPVDGLAFIGSLGEKNILYAFGFSGNGMTYSAIAAMMMRDRIQGKNNPLEAAYRADRLPHMKAFFRKGRDFAEELIRGVVKSAIPKKNRQNGAHKKGKKE